MAIEFEGFRNINIPAPKRTDYTAEELATFLKELESKYDRVYNKKSLQILFSLLFEGCDNLEDEKVKNVFPLNNQIWGYSNNLPNLIRDFCGQIVATPISITGKGLPLQRIFYGAPGTGKSHIIKGVEKLLDKDNVFRTTFHPDSDYASFVGTYKPTMKECETEVVPVVSGEGVTFKPHSAVKETKIVYDFVPQVFLKAYVRAWSIWQNTMSKMTVSKSTVGDITVRIDGVEVCKDAPMSTAGMELMKRFVDIGVSESLEDIVGDWNKILSPQKPDYFLLDPETTETTIKDNWPSVEIGGKQYRFVNEMHSIFWEKFCDDVKKLFEKYGHSIEITSVEKQRKRKNDGGQLESVYDDNRQIVLLVIEEINRGNCAQIFGDIFQLLDRGNGDFSEYPIVPDKDIKEFLNKEFESVRGRYTDDLKNEINRHFDDKDVATDILSGEALVLPPNLYIWATMNTSDQSLFPIDSAFKRRWDWTYVPIDTAKENWDIEVGGKRYSWTEFLNKVNDELLTDETAEDKHLGFYFCKAENKTISKETFVGKVLFYLWNDVFKVYGIPTAIGSSKDWGYTKFYKTDGTVDEDKINSLMEQLKIDPIQ